MVVSYAHCLVAMPLPPPPPPQTTTTTTTTKKTMAYSKDSKSFLREQFYDLNSLCSQFLLFDKSDLDGILFLLACASSFPGVVFFIY